MRRAGTADVQRMLREPGSEFFISRLATVEMLSGFAGKVRTGHALRCKFRPDNWMSGCAVVTRHTLNSKRRESRDQVTMGACAAARCFHTRMSCKMLGADP